METKKDPLCLVHPTLDKIISKLKSNIEFAENDLKRTVQVIFLEIAGREIPDKKNIDDEYISMLQDSVGTEAGGIIARYILCLLCESEMKWLINQHFRPYTLSILEGEYSNDIYKCLKSEPKLGHEKVDVFQEAIKQIEQDFEEALVELTSLDRIGSHRKKMLKVINKRLGKLIISPLLPSDISAKLSELFTRTDYYLSQRESMQVVDAYKRAVSGIDEFIEAMNSSGSYYSMLLCIRIGQVLKDYIIEDFSENRAAQPGNLNVTPSNKKYPLHIHDIEFPIRLILTNLGPGYAFEANLQAVSSEEIELLSSEIALGRISPNSSSEIVIPGKSILDRDTVEICLQCEWKDFDGRLRQTVNDSVLYAQTTNTDWDVISRMDPYSLEPIYSEEDLIGRKEVLDRLIGLTTSKSVGSSIIWGQKRVGKTSIARALQSHLERNGYHVIYIDDFIEPSAENTIARLGKRLCKEIKKIQPKAIPLENPNFIDSLSPMSDFLDSVQEIEKECRYIFILDEFDELPIQLYSMDELGNAFFLTLRSLSSRRDIGFILVGGEKMGYIMDNQGDKLNKWNVIAVDYFSSDSDWEDYKELVTRPVDGILEYTDEAIRAVFEVTAGNPFFTNILCKHVLETATKRIDNHITPLEIESSASHIASTLDRNIFAHFWTDSIMERVFEKQEKIATRAKILVSLSDSMNHEGEVLIEDIQKSTLVREIVGIDNEIREFVARKILVEEKPSERFRFKVKLFEMWLEKRGISDLIASLPQIEAALQARLELEKLRVTSEEIVNAISDWGTFKGQVITEEKVSAWIRQFGSIENQRAIFPVLKGIKYFNESYLRKRMPDIHKVISSGLVMHLQTTNGHSPKETPRYKKRSDILVSYLDSVAQSGATLARMYAQESGIYIDNVVPKEKIVATVQSRANIKVLALIDDFIGTGEQVTSNLIDLCNQLSETLVNRPLRVVFIAIAAYIDGWRKLEATAEDLPFEVHLHACEFLDETAKCFSKKTQYYSNENQREQAKKITLEKGKLLEKNCPLGYGDLELAVVFDRNCPNNSLPILWSTSTNPKWTPLFKRI